MDWLNISARGSDITDLASNETMNSVGRNRSQSFPLGADPEVNRYPRDNLCLYIHFCNMRQLSWLKLFIFEFCTSITICQFLQLLVMRCCCWQVVCKFWHLYHLKV